MSNKFEVKPSRLFIRNTVSDGRGAYAKPAGTIQHRLTISTENIADLPEELFAVKISQSQKPDRKGKMVFSYFSFALDGVWDSLVPAQLIGKDVSELKDAFIKLQEKAENEGKSLEWNVNVNLPGKYLNVETTAHGRIRVYDNDKYPETQGLPQNPDGTVAYYLKGDANVVVHFELSEHRGNEYYRITMTSDDHPDNLFIQANSAKEWTPGGVSEVSAPAFEQASTNEDDNPWG